MGYGADISGGMIATSGSSAYAINRSLRFRAAAGAYLTRTPTVSGNSQKWTWSGWVKRGALSAYQTIFGQGTGTAANGYGYIRFDNTDTFTIFASPDGATSSIVWTSTPVYRDPSAWYHIVAVLDTTQATAANRFILYVNGVSQAGSFSTTPSQNANIQINRAAAHQIGVQNASSLTYYLDGYLAEVNFIDGQALTPFAFGNFNPTTGIWGANKYVGTYGTNGFYLPFTDTSGLTVLSNTGLGRDFSGNGNFWATTNISLATATTIQNFTTVGTSSWTAPAGVTSVNYLVVAGGGAGTSDLGGGGGGGGVLQGNVAVIPGQTYTVIVGAGGASSSANGGNSQFGIVTATGGGGGNAGNGGSGGGQRSSTGPAGIGIVGQGFNGGYAPGISAAGGGGGGAGAPGTNATTTQNPNGGIGVVSYISGTGTYYGGGGGGGGGYSTTPSQSSPSGGSGGLGGGGAGGTGPGPTGSVGTAGSTNTGGGGGGGGVSVAQGNGGSGIVILAYTLPGSATTYDSMLDSPTLANGSTANYATLNPLAWRFAIAQGTFSDGNLSFTYSGGSSAFGFGTIGASAGRWYFEGTLVSRGPYAPGIGLADLQVQWGVNTNLIEYAPTGGLNPGGGPFAPYYSNDIIGVAYDLYASVVYFYKNGVLQGSIPLTSGVTYFPLFDSVGSAIWAANFGQRPFAYSPPSGFDPLNTYNLTSPIIPAGNVAVNAITFTGNYNSVPVGLGQLPKRTASTLVPVNSLRLRNSNSGYLNRYPISTSNQRTYTLSFWVKRGLIGGTYADLFCSGTFTNPFTVFFWNDQLVVAEYDGGSANWGLNTTAVFKDASQWYHVVVAIDTTQPLAANRVIIYVNNIAQPVYQRAGYPNQYPSQNSLTWTNGTNFHLIGWGSNTYFDGYIAEFNLIDGQQLAPSAFGVANADGQWVPIPYTGALGYGTNGFRLPFTGNTAPSFAGSFNGSSQWVSTGTADSRLNMAQGNWTVEGWYYSTNVNSNNARYMVFQPSQALGADTSGTNNTITVSGAPTWNQFSPYGTSTQGGSLYFNGTSASLQSTSSTGNYLFGSSNFTIEAWIYPLNISAYQYIASVWGVVGQTDNVYSSWQLRINSSGNLETVLNNGSTNTTLTGSTVLALRQWQHVAMVRNGNTITLFVNGSSVGSTTYTSALNNVPTTQFVIGQQLSNSYYFNGYLTNLRIVNGTAVYTTTWFVPPTAALPIVNSTQTVLLMDVGSAGAYITDSSSYAQTLTVNGTLAYNAASPYSPVNLGGSAYFDGSSANFNVTTVSAFQLATANTPFTIECWVYPVTQLNGTGIITGSYPGSGNIPFVIAGATTLAGSNASGSFLSAGYFNGSSYQMVIQTATSLTLNTWSHIALSYDGTTARLFLNGIQLGSVTGAWTTAAIQSPLYIGRRWDTAGTLSFFNGYITNVRFVNGISQYGQNFTPVTTTSLPVVPGTVLLMNMTSNGNTYGVLPSTSTDFNLNLFGTGNLFATINASMKLNVWQHLALVRNGQVTTLYVDGVASAATAQPWWPNSNVTVFFGGVSGTYVAYFTGNISNFRINMGYAVYTSNFTPSTAPLTSIPGTALLTMNSSTVADSAGNFNLTNNNSVSMASATPFQANVSMDASGNFNNWFVNNVGMTSTTITYDIMTDVPADSSGSAANWAVLNPLYNPTYAPIGGNLDYNYSAASNNSVVAANTGVNSGRWYWEAYQANGAGLPGIISPTDYGNTSLSYVGASATSYGYYSNGNKYNNGSSASYGASFTTGDIIGIALDLVAGTLTFYKNGVSQGVAYSGLSGTFYPATGNNSATNAGSFNFGQRPFAYTPPVGFSAINTYNNPVTTAWWGNGNSYPDLTWIKSRSNATSHMLMDTVRGPGTFLSSNNTNQQWGSGGAYNWSRYGLVLANDGNTNVAGNTYVMWGWTAGQGNLSINGSGSITSTVSANPVAGFSIVTYPGNGSFGATVGHGLGVIPSMIIIKALSSIPNTSNWIVLHQNATTMSNYANSATFQLNNYTNILTLNTNNAVQASYVMDTQVNGQGYNYLAYCWASVPGYSAFGSYVGNGSTTAGPFVYTGFRPKWIMWKNTTNNGGYSWEIADTTRMPANQVTTFANELRAESTAAESGGPGDQCDILSNGFRMFGTGGGNNSNGDTFIYAAFAENPFKYALAR